MEGGYHNLEIYQLSHEIGIKIHNLSMHFPKYELYEEGCQIRRSSKSVSTNIVEGFALRKYKNEFIHYLYRAYGSSEETLEHLRYLFETKSNIDEKTFNELRNDILKLNSMIFRFIQSVEKKHQTPAFLKDVHSDYPSDT